MRATLIACAITLAVFAFAATAYGGDCDRYTNCTACLAHSDSDCGWCFDWPGCARGDRSGPWTRRCKMWHSHSCLGVTDPSDARCDGPPISPERVRKLIGTGNSSAIIAKNAKWSALTRKCNSVTGCSYWSYSNGTPPTSTVSLLASFGTVYLNIMTGNCTERTCDSNGYQLPLFDSRVIGIQSSEVGESSLSFDHNSVPFYSCKDRKCNAHAWTGPGGTSQFVLTATLTDHCLLIASDYSGSSSDPAVDYVELFLRHF